MTAVEPTLFPLPEPVAAPMEYARLSPDARRTARHNAALAAGRHPFGRPLLAGDHTCASCVHAVCFGGGSRRYWKCDTFSLSHSAASDLRLKWPACVQWEQRP